MSTPSPSPTPPPPATGPVIVYNARMADIAPTVVSEQVAEIVSFNYNALTQGSNFTFQSRAYLYVQGEPQAIATTAPSFLQVDVADNILLECFGQGVRDPVTGADLSQISVAGIGIIIKSAFDILYNRQATAQSEPNPDQPYPSIQSITQANYLYDLYGSGEGGYPLGKAFGGLGTTDGVPSPTPAPTPPNPFTSTLQPNS